jgi:integrase
MRIGEIGALRYADIRDNTIHVERTITRTEVGSYRVGDDAKTVAGRRSIPMNEQIEKIINEQKELNMMLTGGIMSINDYLFKAVEGGLLSASPIDREIKRICKAAGIEPFTMHALRATFATRAIESGMNPKTLQEILGHSNFNITMSLYGHCLADTKKQEMDAIIIAI